MTKQVTGSVRSRKKWKKLLDTIIKILIEAPSGEERKAVVRIEFVHFAKRPEWLPEGKRIKLLDKSAIWEYNSAKLLSNAYDCSLTDTSYADIIKLKREFSMSGYEAELDKMLDINVKEYNE